MDPTIPFGVSLLAHVVSEITGHELYAKVTGPTVNRLLRNHDLSSALENSYLAAIKMLEENFLRTRAGDDESAAHAFKALRSQAIGIMAMTSELSAEDAVAMLRSASAPAHLVQLVNAVVGEESPTVKEYVDRQFSKNLVFAFKQIGLKGNEAVRALLVQSELGQISDAIDALPTRDEISDRLQAFSEELREMRKIGQDIHGHVAELTAKAPGRRRQAWLLVADADGTPIVVESIKSQSFTVGRKDVDIRLQDADISRRHARFSFTGPVIQIENLGSKNGIIVNGDRVNDSGRLRFEDEIEIGKFILTFYPPDSARDELPSLRTG